MTKREYKEENISNCYSSHTGILLFFRFYWTQPNLSSVFFGRVPNLSNKVFFLARSELKQLLELGTRRYIV